MKPLIPFLIFVSTQAFAELEAPVKDPIKSSSISCPTTSGYSEMCYLDIDAGVITQSCNPSLLSQVQVVSAVNGMVIEVDMTAWKSLQVGTRIQNPQGYSLHIGNSPTNNAWGGDSGNFSNDSEIHLYNDSLYVYGNDHIGSPLLHTEPGAVPSTGLPYAWATVCDSYFEWYSWDPVSNTGSNFTITDVTGLFQIDGNEPDQNPSGNDRKLYIGFERTISNASRDGGDLVEAPMGDLGEGVDVQLILTR